MAQAKFKDVCRLCGRVNGIFMSIFDSAPENECLLKIEAVVPEIIILRNDSLSKLVCHRCVAKVKEFYDFKESCVNTQVILKKRVPWMSFASKRTPSRAVSPVVRYIGGPLAYPYGQPEPEVEVLTLSDDEDNEKSTTSPNQSLASGYSNSQQTITSREVNKSLSSPVQRFPGSHSFRNGNGDGTGTVAVQISPAMHHDRVLPSHVTPVLTSTTDSSGSHRQSLTSPQSQRTSQASTSLQGKSSFPGFTSKSLPPHPFRSFSQFHQSLAAVKMNKTTYQQTAAPGTLMAEHPSKRACLQVPGQSGSDQNERISWTPPTQRSISGTSSVDSIAVGGSETSARAGLPLMPPSVPITSPQKFPQSNKNVHIPGCNNLLPAGSSIPLTARNYVCDSTVKAAKAQKPRPKSKKKPVVFNQEDISRICERNPSIDSLKIYENSFMFKCKLCNIVLLNEDAVISHKCVTAGDTEAVNVLYNGQSNINTSDQLLNYNENSNHSASSCVELSSDDEISNCNLAPKHNCNICDKKFHNLARLQKHELSHKSNEGS